MTEKRITTEITIRIHDDPEQRVLPAFYEEAGSVAEGERELFEIGRSTFGPFTYYLFSEENPGPNGPFLATINVQAAIEAVIERWPELRTAVVEEAAS